jgi:OOP family OmpA-OmpF porin
MKKYFGIAAFAALLVTASTSSFAADQGAFFINTNVGQSNFHDHGDFSSDTPINATLRAGYYWQSEVWDFGLEGGYASLGKAKGSIVVPGFSTFNYAAKVDGPLAGATLKYKFQNRMFLSARAGYFGSRINLSGDGLGSQTKSGGGSYIGAGVGYDLTPHFSLGVNWDEYRARVSSSGVTTKFGITVLSGFAEYRF